MRAWRDVDSETPGFGLIVKRHHFAVEFWRRRYIVRWDR